MMPQAPCPPLFPLSPTPPPLPPSPASPLAPSHRRLPPPLLSPGWPAGLPEPIPAAAAAARRQCLRPLVSAPWRSPCRPSIHPLGNQFIFSRRLYHFFLELDRHDALSAVLTYNWRNVPERSCANDDARPQSKIITYRLNSLLFSRLPPTGPHPWAGPE
jgi:hypothetical protein